MSHAVYTNGAFGILHQGHINILEYCRRLAGPNAPVVVGMNTDKWIIQHKGYKPPNFTTRTKELYALMSLSLDGSYYGLPLVSIVTAVDKEQDICENLAIFTKWYDIVYLVKGNEYKEYEITGHDIPKVTVVRPPVTKDIKGKQISSTQIAQELGYDRRTISCRKHR